MRRVGIRIANALLFVLVCLLLASIVNQLSAAALAVPAALGFGKAGTKGVPPNADLTYFIELVEVSKGRNRRRKKKKEL